MQNEIHNSTYITCFVPKTSDLTGQLLLNNKTVDRYHFSTKDSPHLISTPFTTQATRSSLRGCKVQNFPGGVYLQTLYKWVCYHMLWFPPSEQKTVLIPGSCVCRARIQFQDCLLLVHLCFWRSPDLLKLLWQCWQLKLMVVAVKYLCDWDWLPPDALWLPTLHLCRLRSPDLLKLLWQCWQLKPVVVAVELLHDWDWLPPDVLRLPTIHLCLLRSPDLLNLRWQCLQSKLVPVGCGWLTLLLFVIWIRAGSFIGDGSDVESDSDLFVKVAVEAISLALCTEESWLLKLICVILGCWNECCTEVETLCWSLGPSWNELLSSWSSPSLQSGCSWPTAW